MTRDPRKLAMMISLAASVVMLVGKLTAYAITHSAAMLADAAESVVHGVATGFAAFSLWYAARPADAEHPYGHGRIVYFSMGFEGALILAASMAVIYSGVDGLLRGRPLDRLGTGLVIAGALAAINLVLGISLVRIGRQHNAIVLVSNGKHVLSDFWTTAAAIFGVAAVMMTGAEWVDGMTAIVIGGLIMISGISLLRQSYAGLMDAIDADTLSRIEGSLSHCVETGVISEYHHLRCRRINDEMFIDVHLLADGNLPLSSAHARATRAEEAIRALFPNDRLHIASHIEPSDHEAAHPGGHDYH